VKTMVCFQAAGTDYCMPVEATRAVRPSLGMVVLPDARADVVGLIPGDPPLTVISPLGAAGGGQILVIHTGEVTFGLLVDTVSGLRKVDDAGVRVAPQGQDRALISGTVDADGGMLLVADAAALGERL
jgi:chemotaxis signal transduction protein